MKQTDAQKSPATTQELLCAVLDDGDIALVRVVGRGSFSNSVAFKDFVLKVQRRNPKVRLIIDMNDCQSMDSTFMGVLAGIAIAQKKNGGDKVTLVNICDHCAKLLKNLGVAALVDMRKESSSDFARPDAELSPAELKEMDRAEQICLTLRAHRQLVMLDEQNDVRFQAVIEYLEKSLEEEGGSC